MPQGKRKHHYTRTLRIAHKDGITGGQPILRVPMVVKNPIRSADISSDTLWKSTSNFGSGVSHPTVKGPKTYYAQSSGFIENTYLGNTTITMTAFPSTNFKLGENSYMDLNKVRIITKIKVICISNVNSQILNPPIGSSTTKIDPPQKDSYRNYIDAFRLNPRGFQGFNIYKINKKDWANRHKYHFSHLYNNECLFKSQETHHSEYPYEADYLSWVLKKGDDLILWPKFTFFTSANASFILHASNKQVVSVSLPYYEYIVDMNYFDI